MRAAIIPVCLLLVSCNEDSDNISHDKPVTQGHVVMGKGNTNPNSTAKPATALHSRVLSIQQDKTGAYWLATNTEGVYHYEGKSLTQYTKEHGLGSEQVHEVRESTSGTIYLYTGAGISRFDGKRFISYPNYDLLRSHRTEHWEIAPGDVLFGAEGGVYRCRDTSVTYLPLPVANTQTIFTKDKSEARRHTVYCTLKDSKGNYWLGTASVGVCCYDGKSFTWFTQKGVAGPPMQALAEDRNGNIWFGNNGYGLVRWDGKAVTNITDANGLSNDHYMKNKRVSDKPGTMARVWSIQEDISGNLWVATVDAGVWHYNGKTFVNYTAKDGIPNGVVNTIYRDRNGTMLFGTSDGVYTFNGVSFAKLAVKG